MAKQSPHTRWKGCCLMCAVHRDAGTAARTPWSALRRLGKRRRLSRHDLGGGW